MTALDTTRLPARELLEHLLTCESQDEMQATIQNWLQSNPPQVGAQVVYAVFAAVRGGVDHDYVAAYAKREQAQAFVDMQSEQLQQCLTVWEIELDRHPSDPYWTKPPALER
jgi:hypothetical protein